MATTNDQAVINLGRLKTYDTLLKKEVKKDVDGLQGQIDSVKAIATSAIETHFGAGEPTTDNWPAREWTTDELKKQHIGDLFYIKGSGAAYRYMLDGGEYKWEAIPDTIAFEAENKAEAALQAASAAFTKVTDAVTKANSRIGKIQLSVHESTPEFHVVPNTSASSDDGKTFRAEIALFKKLDGGIKSDNSGLYVDTDVIATKASVDAKQDKLTAGHGIALDGATISAKAAADGPVTVTAAGIGIADGTTSTKGAVRLSDAVNSTSTTLAATASAVKKAYDLAAGKQSALTFATDDDINAMFA